MAELANFQHGNATEFYSISLSVAPHSTTAVLDGVKAAAKRAKARARQGKSTYLPPVSLLKPLYGAEPGLREYLESFFALGERPFLAFPLQDEHRLPAGQFLPEGFFFLFKRLGIAFLADERNKSGNVHVCRTGILT